MTAQPLSAASHHAARSGNTVEPARDIAGSRGFSLRFPLKSALPVILALAALAASAALSGCRCCGGGGRIVDFDLVDQQYVMKPGTLAVVSGNNTRFDAQLAEVVTRKLRIRCSLKVLTQAEIKARAKGYPSDMVSADESSDLARESPYWFDQSDAAKIAFLQKQLKTDYVLVVWGNHLTKITEVGGMIPSIRYKYGSNFHSRLFEFPSKRIVGYSGFGRIERASSGSALMDENDPEKGIWQLIRLGAGDIVDEFINATKTQKEGKEGGEDE